MSYYCLYYAAQQGILAKSAQDTESKRFLFGLLDKLEEVSGLRMSSFAGCIVDIGTTNNLESPTAESQSH